jgi:DNA-directed RNA polymerase specialized sigma24 family protein
MAAAPPDADDPLLAAYLERRANLVRFLAARAGSLAAAEDLAQDRYLKLAARDRGEAVGNPAAMLYRMALNLMLDRARGEARSAARDTAWRQVERTELGGVDVADEPPADEAAASAQRLRQLVAAVRELPPQAGRAFRLHKLEGLSHA